MPSTTDAKLRKIANVNKFYPLSPDAKVHRELGRNFAEKSGFSIKLPGNRGAIVLIDRRFTAGDRKDKIEFISRPQTIAHIETCSGVVWEIKTEPTGSDTFGMILYTKKGKPIGAGEGKILARGDVKYTLGTLYKGITNKVKLEVKAEGKANSDGTYSGTVSVSASTDIC